MSKENRKINPMRIALVVGITVILLIVVSIFYPKDGIRIAGKDFYFLRFENVINSAKETKIDPDKLVEQRLDSVKREFNLLDSLSTEAATVIALETANSDSTRMVFPNDERNSLDLFFEALYRIKETKEQVRVIHYGDSQIEEDRMSSYLRRELQARFGGGGLGMVSSRPISGTISASHAYSNNWKRYTAFSLTGEPLASKRYGSMGITCKYQGNVSSKEFPKFEEDTTKLEEAPVVEDFVLMDKNKGYLTLKPIDKNNPNLYQFDRVRVFMGDVQENIQLSVVTNTESHQENIVAGLDYKGFNFDFKNVPSSVAITFSGGASPEIYGISLETSSGVVVDNVAMRGSDGSVFVKFQQAIAKAMFTDLDPKLIILQFGGNVMPGLSGEKSAKYYGKQLTNSIQLIRRYCPNASFLFVGPADMAKMVNGQLQTYPLMETLIKELKNICVTNNVAFFDMYNAMGGKNSMIAWVKKGWAAKDYIHFNRKGAEKMAEIMHQYLMLEYELFLLRTGKDRKKDA